MKKILFYLLIFKGMTVYSQLPELAQTPPMGWNSWNAFDLLMGHIFQAWWYVRIAAIYLTFQNSTMYPLDQQKVTRFIIISKQLFK